MSRNTSNKDKIRELNRQAIKLSHIITIAIILLLFIAIYLVQSKNGEFKIDELFNNVLGNLMGVLAGFLIFDVVDRKLALEGLKIIYDLNK